MKSLYFILTLLGCSVGLMAQDSTFTSRDLILPSDSVSLAATLVQPARDNRQFVIVWIAGSGPTDRNGNSGGMRSESTRKLAEALARHGWASLRYDKRGVGASSKIKSEWLRFDHGVSDAVAFAQYLKKSEGYKHIVFAGHSEGSLVGMLAAQRFGASGFISLAGAGRPADVIITEQLATSSNNNPQLMKYVERGMTKLRAGQPYDSVPPFLQSIFRKNIQGYLMSWMRYDPAVEIAKLQRIPVLIVQGTTDIQVPVEDAALLQRALPSAQLKLITGMNHIFRDAPASRTENLATYTNPDLPLSASLVPVLHDFMHQLKAKK